MGNTAVLPLADPLPTGKKKKEKRKTGGKEKKEKYITSFTFKNRESHLRVFFLFVPVLRYSRRSLGYRPRKGVVF